MMEIPVEKEISKTIITFIDGYVKEYDADRYTVHIGEKRVTAIEHTYECVHIIPITSVLLIEHYYRPARE